MRVLVIFLCSALFCAGCSSVIKLSGGEKTITNREAKEAQAAKFWGIPKDIDNPEWKPVLVSPDGIIVVWKYEYGLVNADTVRCIGLWVSENEYLCTYKDMPGRRLMKNKITDIFYSGL